MDATKVDLLLEYALAVAAEADDQFDRRLGKIHLIKYVYLADLAYAEKHGETFTGAPWRFYHYGPWDTGVCNRIDPVLSHLGAHEFIWTSTKYDNDSVRWSIDADDAEQLISDLDKALPVPVTLAIRRAVRSFGNDTSSLLHHVYTTDPMLHAAPGQVLRFSVVEKTNAAPTIEDTNQTKPAAEPTAKELKRRREAMNDLKAKFQAAVASAGSRNQRKRPSIEPIYDEIFFAGARQVDDLAGPTADGLTGNATLLDSVWESEVRKRGQLP